MGHLTPAFEAFYPQARDAAADGLGVDLALQYAATQARTLDEDLAYEVAAQYQQFVDSDTPFTDQPPELVNLGTNGQIPIDETEAQFWLDDDAPQYESMQLSRGNVARALAECQEALAAGQLVNPDDYDVLYRAKELAEVDPSSSPYDAVLMSKIDTIVK